jgi:hypothetical protein
VSARRLLLALALLGWLGPAVATLGPDHPLRQGARRLVHPSVPVADAWDRTLHAVAERVPAEREVGVWLDRMPATPDEIGAWSEGLISAAHRLYPRRVLPLAPEPVIAALESRALVAPAVAGVMRARLEALGRRDASAPVLLVRGGSCQASAPAPAGPLRVLLAVPGGGCLLVAEGTAG